MRISGIGLAFLALGIACRSGSKAAPEAKTSGSTTKAVEGVETPDFRPELQFKNPSARALPLEYRSLTDRLMAGGPDVLLFATCGDPEGKGPTRVERVPDANHWPEDRLVMYVFLLDARRRIHLAQIVPNSESGDSYEESAYLFDDQGARTYWEIYRGTIDSEAAPAKEWSAQAFARDGRLLDQALQRWDAAGHPWKGAGARAPQPQYRSLQELLAKEGLLSTLKAGGFLPQPGPGSGR